jgi:hypothetical protein
MPQAIRQAVMAAAQGRCAYCLSPEQLIGVAFGVDAEIWVHTCWGHPNQQRVYWEPPSYERALPYLLQLQADVITFECASTNGRDLPLFAQYPQFAEKAGVILDLYAGLWQGEALGANDYILSADEKTSIQARVRCHPTLAPAPGRQRRVEHEYDRGGALQYLAAWDVQRGSGMGRCEPCTGIEPFGRLVTQVMEQEPYRSADRVFWVVDNGSPHRGHAAAGRLVKAYAHAILVHTPVHASWLNQVEIYCSIVQRKVLTPNDFASLADVEQRLQLYEALLNQQPRPFAWKFTRAHLAEFLKRLEAHGAMLDHCQAVPDLPDTEQGELWAA